MFVRRRPLLRAAVVGGGAYVAGKRSGQRAANQEQEQQSGSEAHGDQPSVSDQLAQLSSMHAQGSLSDAEFASAKARLLGS
jgi:hypothetical protein